MKTEIVEHHKINTGALLMLVINRLLDENKIGKELDFPSLSQLGDPLRFTLSATISFYSLSERFWI